MYGLNHQVNQADLVQIKVKHEIWQVQNTRHAVASAGQSHTRLPKYQETSSCFSLCCFVIYVYIFVLGKTAGFVCHHFFKKGTTQ